MSGQNPLARPLSGDDTILPFRLDRSNLRGRVARVDQTLDRILAFDRALAGRPLDGHRLDAAVALVERLKAGLGGSLNGLSEDAQITALDWSAAIASGNGRAAAGGPIILVHSAAAGA